VHHGSLSLTFRHHNRLHSKRLVRLLVAGGHRKASGCACRTSSHSRPWSEGHQYRHEPTTGNHDPEVRYAPLTPRPCAGSFLCVGGAPGWRSSPPRPESRAGPSLPASAQDPDTGPPSPGPARHQDAGHHGPPASYRNAVHDVLQSNRRAEGWHRNETPRCQSHALTWTADRSWQWHIPFSVLGSSLPFK
jgi:hypothetical protein